MSAFRVQHHDELDSTNSHALARLAALSDGDVIEAGVQTAGRGRLSRRWISDVPGNVSLSLVLKPAAVRPDGMPWANLSQLLALSVCDVLEAHGVSPSIKWPNDVLVGGAKIAGILAELASSGASVRGLVLGLGVNLNLDAKAVARIDQPATALNLLLGRPVAVEPFRDALLANFFSLYPGLVEEGFRAIREAFVARCAFLGRPMVIRQADGAREVVARTITERGTLTVERADGRWEEVDWGEIAAGSEPMDG